MSTPTVTAGTGPFSVSVDPTGHVAYVANFSSDSVSQYAIGADGSLPPLGTPAAAGSHPAAIVTAAAY